MANRKRSAREKKQGRETMKVLKFGAIPLIVILLIIVILVADRRKKEESVSFAPAGSWEAEAPEGIDHEDGWEDGSYGDQESISAAGDGDSQNPDPDSETPPEQEESSSEPIDPFQQPLQQDALLELTGLVRLYCEAKTDCDADLLAQVFGIGDWTEERKEQERAKMELVKASVKSYENISCYSVQGPETDSYVIFPYYEIRYREIETLVPAISWAYVKRDENGQYYMVSETEESTNDYIRKVGEKPEVKAVMAQVQARQQEAIGSDEALQRIYGGGEGSEVVIGGQ